jgi:hypothetical protein
MEANDGEPESRRRSGVSVFNRLPTEGYTQGGKFWVRGR